LDGFTTNEQRSDFTWHVINSDMFVFVIRVQKHAK